MGQANTGPNNVQIAAVHGGVVHITQVVHATPASAWPGAAPAQAVQALKCGDVATLGDDREAFKVRDVSHFAQGLPAAQRPDALADVRASARALFLAGVVLTAAALGLADPFMKLAALATSLGLEGAAFAQSLRVARADGWRW